MSSRVSVEQGSGPWAAARRFGFRFGALYWLLFMFPFPLAAVAFFSSDAFIWYSELTRSLSQWVARSVLGIERPMGIEFNGSGDLLADYVFIGVILTVSVVGAAVWSAAARSRDGYPRLAEVVRLLLRYYLALVMLGYGFAKVFNTQFPAPGPERLMQPFGDASPMGLLWTFMGASQPYTMFGGAMEVIAGLLLLSRRTTTAGALVTAAVMTNIVAMNFCYDVPVKIFSTHLLIIAVVLMAPDARRLARLLVLNRPTEPAAHAVPLAARVASPRRRRWLIAAKVVAIGMILHDAGWTQLERWRERGDHAPLPALAGSWDVERHEVGGRELPPLLTESARWQRVEVGRYRTTFVSVSGERQRVRAVWDEDAGTVELIEWDDDGTKTTHELAVTVEGDGAVQLHGTFHGESLTVKLRRAPEREWLLETRGFHWVNEYPFNR